MEEFFESVSVTDLDSCWLWTGNKTKDGYGRCSVFRYGDERAHRVAFQLWYGVRPGPFMVCHSCDTPLCVNPTHLWLGTSSDNMRDAIRKGRKKGFLPGASNPMYGKGHLRQGALNPMYGRTGVLNHMYGRKHTEAAKRAMSEKRRAHHAANGPRVWTDEQRAKVSAYASTRTGEKNPFYGRRHTPETKAKMRAARAARAERNR